MKGINTNWIRTITGLLIGIVVFGSCNNPKSNVPVIGFVDAFEDNTIAQAKQGFFDALKKNGYSEEANTIKIIYRNAQGDIPKLTLSVKYFISEKVTLIATSPSLSTITAIQNTKDIPVFMMVSPTPQLMNVVDKRGNAPANLFGVAEDLAYIDTSFSMIGNLLPNKYDRLLRIGMIYNQSEPQSAEALKRIQELAKKQNVELVSLPVNTTADVQLVTQALLAKHIDAFFANPDNTVFSSFETILKACNDAKVPVFTSEAGLVTRGAVAAYGADIYQWGYQAGEQAALLLKNKSTEGIKWEMVKLRKRVYNAAAAKQFGINVPANFEAVK
ncbi:MAG TPA: ABC transporter substrate-binding protein [Bacteroidia bacterium]|jgi:putative ABC transport system substrate-binding protein|nr:ABC transporter substrate-binding protein [Bacteroidia bacterium]